MRNVAYLSEQHILSSLCPRPHQRDIMYTRVARMVPSNIPVPPQCWSLAIRFPRCPPVLWFLFAHLNGTMPTGIGIARVLERTRVQIRCVRRSHLAAPRVCSYALALSDSNPGALMVHGHACPASDRHSTAERGHARPPVRASHASHASGCPPSSSAHRWLKMSTIRRRCGICSCVASDVLRNPSARARQTRTFTARMQC